MAPSGPAPSGSATTIVSARFYHVVKIDGYTRTLNAHNGLRQHFNSRPFRAGGRTWRVSYRPMGSTNHPENIDSISMYLALDDAIDEPVNAQATFSLLDQEDKPVHAYSWTTRAYSFSKRRGKAYGYERFIKREALERSEYLKDDRFAVGVNVHLVKEAAPSPAVPDADMHRHLGALLSSGEGADVKFRVGQETFAAHRLVLAARSPVFRAALYGPMREGTTTDAVRIDDMEAQVFQALLVFVYTDTWPEVEREDEPAMSQHLLVAADRYGLDRLKLVCEDKLLGHIDASFVAGLVSLADRHHCPRLKKACFRFRTLPASLLARALVTWWERRLGSRYIVALDFTIISLGNVSCLTSVRTIRNKIWTT